MLRDFSQTCTALGRSHLCDGGTLIVDVADGQMRLQSFDSVLADFRSLPATKIPPGVSLADELIAERRAEAARE